MAVAASSTEQATTMPTPVSSADVSLNKRGLITGTLNKKGLEALVFAEPAERGDS
jgi:hypothetical protein